MSEDFDFAALFLDEGSDILSDWESTCLNLRANLDDIGQWDRLFRCAHNLKGSAKSVGFDKLGEFIHHVEDYITLLRKGEAQRSSQAIDILLSAQETMVGWLEGLRSNPDFLPHINEVLERVNKMTGKAGSSAISAAGASDDSFVDFSQPEATASAKKDIGTILVENGSISADALDKAVQIQNRKLGQILVSEGLAPQKAVDDALMKQKASGAPTDETVRVSTRKLDALIRAAGESAIQYSIIQHHIRSMPNAPQGLISAMDLGEKVVKELHESSLTLRMQPLSGLFQRLERVIMDVSSQLNKKVQVVLAGQHTELDKTVVETIKDPLIHIVRNAVDHGLETNDARVNAGKESIGTVWIEAEQTADSVTLKIRDNGKGLDPEKLRRKAVEKGLIPPDQKLTDQQAQELIFLPGFSTAEKITDVSGRGVGMDVVKRSIDELRGKVNISSKLGAGTTFEISLPSNLAIIEALLINADGHEVVVPLQAVNEIIDAGEYSATKTKSGHEAILVRGKAIALRPLSGFLDASGVDLGPPTLSASSGGRPALVVTRDDASLAFGVTSVIRMQTVVVRPLTGSMKGVSAVSGTTILPNGSPGVIVDINQCLGEFVNAIDQVGEKERKNVG